MINSRLPKYSSLQQRLDHNSRVDPKSGCRLWTRALNPAGYGIIRVEDKAMLAHRVAWSAKHGPIPPGFSVCHRCDVRNCINPDHLFLGTHKENMVDMKTKMGLRALPLVCGTPQEASGLLRLQFEGREIVSQVLSVRPLHETDDSREFPEFPEDSVPTGS